MITFNNFFVNTEAFFKGCKRPKRKPDFVSKTHYGETSSEYWYGENKKGKFVIRSSDHWVFFKKFDRSKRVVDCPSIASCEWHIKTTLNLKKEKSEHDSDYNNVICGKCYLKNFKEL